MMICECGGGYGVWGGVGWVGGGWSYVLKTT